MTFSELLLVLYAIMWSRIMWSWNSFEKYAKPYFLGVIDMRAMHVSLPLMQVTAVPRRFHWKHFLPFHRKSWFEKSKHWLWSNFLDFTIIKTRENFIWRMTTAPTTSIKNLVMLSADQNRPMKKSFVYRAFGPFHTECLSKTCKSRGLIETLWLCWGETKCFCKTN